MASGSVINQYTNVGFYKAPVSKSLMLVVGCTHAVSHVPAFGPLFKKIFSGSISFSSSRSIVRFIASKLVFPDTRSTILALFLIYFFRIFERRTGSLKFSSNLLLSWFLGISLDLLVTLVTPENWSPLLTPGPLALVLPLFIPFYLHIPLTSSAHFGPLPVSTKSLPYLLGLQLALHSPSTITSTLCSLLVGLSIHCTALGTLSLPSSIGKVFRSTLGWLLDSSPPPTAPTSSLMGATLEIQRTQQAEAMEQQLLRARARQFNVPVGGRQMRLDELWGQGGGRNGGGAGGAAPPPVQASPAMVQALTDMGFPRQRVEQALVRANNDMDQATNLLLQDM